MEKLLWSRVRMCDGILWENWFVKYGSEVVSCLRGAFRKAIKGISSEQERNPGGKSLEL